MSEGGTPSSPKQPAEVHSAPAGDVSVGEWQWGLGVPPASLPSVSEGLTGTRGPVLPPSSHVHVEGRPAGETMWNPMDGDPLRMAALGAAVPDSLVPPLPPPAAPPSANGNGAPPKPPVPSPVQTGRMRPVTGRRQRDPLPVTVSITAGSYRSNLAPIAPGSAAGAGQLVTPGATPDHDEAVQRPMSSPRSRVWLALVTALVVIGAAAATIWFMMPPRVVLQASLGFERPAGQVENTVLRDFHRDEEARLWDKAVRDAAAATLAKRSDVEPGFLANVHHVMRAARVRWETNADATRDEMMLEYQTTAPTADDDAERLTALFHALHAASAAAQSGGRVDDLKRQLLEGEVADYPRAIEYLTRRHQALQEELRLVRLGAPKEGEVEGLKAEVSRLSAAYQNVLAARIRAEVEAGIAPQPPATMPAVGGAGDSPGAPGLPPPEPRRDETEHQRTLERETLVELRTKEKHLAEAAAQQEAIDVKEREANGVADTMKSLARSLEEKRKELAAAVGERRAVFRPLPPSPARVVSKHDARPFWIGVATAAVSLAFALFVAFAGRGRGAA